jgi:hypothetical protein
MGADRLDRVGRWICLFGLAMLGGFLLAIVPQHRLFLQPNMRTLDNSVHIPKIEFAGDDGIGMGTACACSAITGLRGETVTFARASDGTCFQHSELTGILPGELVTCTTDQPRVQYGGTGAAPLGLSVWQAMTNPVIRNQEVDNVAWLKGTGVNLTTIEADVGYAPDGTLTADRMLSKTGTSYIEQVLVSSATPYALSWFVCGVKTDPDGGMVTDGGLGVDGGDGTGSIPLCGLFNGNTFACSSCAYSACPSYNRCPTYITSNNNAATYPCIGGGCAASPNTITNDVMVWGSQIDRFTAVASVGPYIPTAGTAVTRAVETVSVDAGFLGGSTESFAATVISPNGFVNGSALFDWYNSGANFIMIQALGTTGVVRLNLTSGGVSTTQDSTALLTPNATNRVSALIRASTDLRICVNGTCDTTSLAQTIPTLLTIFPANHQTGGSQFNSTIKKFCADDGDFCQ